MRLAGIIVSIRQFVGTIRQRLAAAARCRTPIPTDRAWLTWRCIGNSLGSRAASRSCLLLYEQGSGAVPFFFLLVKRI